MVKKLPWIVSLVFLVFLGACSSNSEDASTPVVLTGTIATGAGASATITLVGALGNTIEGSSSSAGYYSVNISSLTKPIMIKAVLDRDGATLYSFTSSDSDIVNVTPLTTYVVDQAAVSSGVSGGASQLFSAFEEASAPADVAQEVEQSTQVLNIAIASSMENQGVGDFNHFSGEFDADHSGYDAVLDDLDIEVYEDDVIIRTDSGILNTLNYDISTAEINASGVIYDIATNLPIQDVNVTMVDSVGNTLTASTDVNGSFVITVETMRVYDITVVANGYATQFVPNIPSFVFSETSVGDIPMFPLSSSGSTTVSGAVIDGRTTDTGISNVELTFRSGYEDRLSASVATVTTDETGQYSLSLPIGVYMVEVENENYYTEYVNVVVYGETSTQDYSMLADLSGVTSTNFFATITLNWDENPADLDSHLTGPILNSTERFHLYYYNRYINENATDISNALDVYAREQLGIILNLDLSDATEDELSTYFANLTDVQSAEFEQAIYEYEINMSTQTCQDGAIASLDRDRIGSYGGFLPETTTLCSVSQDALYKYYVHHFSGTGTMSDGNAQVTVATKNGISRTFNAPSTGSIGNNDIWHVFNIDSDGNIYPINEIIGNDESNSTLFAAPARSIDTRFSAEENLFDNLPVK